jgi:hypothetical protein
MLKINKSLLEAELFFITVTCVAFDLPFPTFIMAAKVKYKRNSLIGYHICDV